ncbi:hypothetical protein NEOLI_004340 [Neolecta irregularis DAH-3]|uniref:Uncharacterized protein n=1 Tax=Neolecta irregularis (strain DAH-3) TaxID=1198029 RepID=A0A1U7LMG0_NEOID|nr:hypothetical protein NEOLI_004340 [Neolecta irregularis DAH-3]|eukprot:OLL23844.1 hypothetical protein NEOLI_004340 [Neolecta irregularis DAH-3]
MSERPFGNPQRAVTVVLPSGRRAHRPITLSSETDTGSESGDFEPTQLLDGEDDFDDYHDRRQNLRCCFLYQYYWLKVRRAFSQDDIRGVFKCSLAYFIGSLSVFIPLLGNLLGKSDGKHLVATVAVYFHPFRTIGSMIEANCFALFALALGLFTGIGRDVQEGEFATPKIAQITCIVALGTLISNVVCYTLWPMSAIYDVKKHTVTALHSLADSLSLVTSCYLRGVDINLPTLNSPILRQQCSVDNLLKALGEAWWECLIQGKMQEYRFHKMIIQRLQNLSLALSGLRASSSELRQLLQEAEAVNKRPLDILSAFANHLGPPMKALVYTCRGILREPMFTPAPEFKLLVQSCHRDSLIQALQVYSKARRIALTHLYAHNLSGLTVEEIAASMYFFSFSLEEFTQELIGLLETMTELAQFQINPTKSFIFQRDTLVEQQKFPKLSRNVTNSAQANEPQGSLNILKYKTWKYLKKWRTDEMKFAVKVGVGAAIAVLPSFIDITRPYFRHYRGEWGLLTYMIVCSYSIGATNTAGFYRISGNLLGAAMAVVAWIIFPENPWFLAVWGYIMAIACFYLIIKSKRYTTFGRFILLSYNLILLYAYSLSQADEDEDDEDEGGQAPFIATIAVHRMVAVIAGVVWGMVICAYIWPISARKKLREELSDLWLKMGWSWRLEGTEELYGMGSRKSIDLQSAHDPRVMHPYLTIDRVVLLQQQLQRLHVLLSQTSGETRMKGPFPVTQYTILLSQCQEMLDSFTQMRVALSEIIESNSGQWHVLQATIEERNDLCNRLLLYFYLLASAVRLKFPLPDRFPLPSAEDARDRLMHKLSTLRAKYSDDQDFALLYAYTLVSGQLSDSLDKSFEIVGKLFGKIEMPV